MITSAINAVIASIFVAIIAQHVFPPSTPIPRLEPVRLAALAFTDTVPVGTERESTAEARMIFCSDSGVWRSTQVSASCQAPIPTSWAAIHEGRVVGRVVLPVRTGAAVMSLSSTPLRVREVAAAMRFPLNGERFERWSGPVVYRPLALVTADNVRDPEQWESVDLTRAIHATTLSSVRRAFRSSVTVPRCESVPRSRNRTAPAITAPVIRDRDLMVTTAYQSRTGAMLVGLMLDERAHPCDDVRDPSRTEQWFAIDATRESARVIPGEPTRNSSNTTATAVPRFIGSEMHPIGVADYDGNGHAEWLFSLSRYNEDGYVLMADNFRHLVTTSWHLH